jgi:hypothetical protein
MNDGKSEKNKNESVERKKTKSVQCSKVRGEMGLAQVRA